MWSRILGSVAVAVALVLACSLGTPAQGWAPPQPVLRGHAFGDPSVTSAGAARILVATGDRVERAALRRGAWHWHWAAHALQRLPRWAGRGSVWGPDLARIHHRWVMYYAAPVRGLGATGHCIGVAVGRSAYGTFRPVHRRPLVCERGAHAPRGFDMPHGRRTPSRGVIDPSYFRDRDGRSYLVYKTSGRPSTIRLLPLGRFGLERRPHTHSVELVRSRGIIENPTIVRHRRHYYLLASEGSWSSCGYRETWRASRLLRHWGSRGHALLTRRSTRGVCGPGGADVAGRRRHATLYFHGWVHRGTTKPLRTSRYAGRGARRAMYAARLHWRHGRPAVGRFLRR